MDDSLFTVKTQLRRQLRQARKNLTDDKRRAASRAMVNHAGRFLKRGRRISCYWAFGSELDMGMLIHEAQARGVEMYFPVLPHRGRRMWFARYDKDSVCYREHRFGMLETSGELRRAEQLNLMFVPLLGIDRQGYRLGQGGGFYDATLAFRRYHPARCVRLIGVAYHCQLIDSLPREPWDMPLDGLITERGLKWFNLSSRAMLDPIAQ